MFEFEHKGRQIIHLVGKMADYPEKLEPNIGLTFIDRG
jgi:hypothetical protein